MRGVGGVGKFPPTFFERQRPIGVTAGAVHWFADQLRSVVHYHTHHIERRRTGIVGVGFIGGGDLHPLHQRLHFGRCT